MSARSLSSLTIYTADGALAASPSETAGAFAARITERLGEPPRLMLSGIGGGALLGVYALLGRRAIVRAVLTGGAGPEETYWRVRSVDTAYGQSQSWQAALDPLWLDLDGALVSETLPSTGFVDVGVTMAGTLSGVLARLLLPAYGAPSAPTTFALGAVEPDLAASRVFLTLTNASTLAGIRQALSKSGAELVFAASAAAGDALVAYTLSVVRQSGSRSGARIMAGTGEAVNRIAATRRRDDSVYFSHLAAVADGDSPVTLAGAAWPVATANYFAGPNLTAFTLGGAPVWEDLALVGLFVRSVTGGELYEILATEAPNVVVVGEDARGLTSLVVREAGDRDLVALPAAGAPAALGRRVRRESFAVGAWANALADAGASADFSAFTGGLPLGWTVVGVPVVAAVATEGHVRYGTSSVQVTAARDEGLLSLPIPRLDARQVSAWVGAYVTSAGGRIRLELVDEDGTVHPVGEKVDSTSETLQALSIGGAPLVGSVFRVRLLCDSPTATFIVDAATATRSATAQPYAEAMGPTALWTEAAKVVLAEGGTARPDAIDGRLLDLSAIVEGYDEIRIGDTVTASEEGPHGFTIATRVVEVEQAFLVGGGASEKRIRLSQKRADLRALVEAPPPPDPVPVVEPVRRPQPSAQYGVGFRYEASGAVAVLTWLGGPDVASVRWTLAVGSDELSGTVDAQAGSVDLNAAAPVAPGSTVEVRATAYSESGAAGEVEAAPYRLVTDVPVGTGEDFVGAGATLTLSGTPGEVDVIGIPAQSLASSPSYALGLADDVRVAQSLGLLGGVYLARHASTADHLGVFAAGGASYGYVVARGFLIYEGGTSFTRIEGEVVKVSDNLIRLNSDATTPAAWGGVFVYRGGVAAGKAVVWNEGAGGWGEADISYGAGGAEQIETGTFNPFVRASDAADYARRSANETITGAWRFEAPASLSNAIIRGPETSGGYAGGLLFERADDGGIYTGGVGMLHTNNEPDWLYLAHGADPWVSGAGVYVMPDGRTGIGTTSPTRLLDVAGAARVRGSLLLGEQASAPGHAVRADRIVFISGTDRQVLVTGGEQDMTTDLEWSLSLPQDIATDSDVAFRDVAPSRDLVAGRNVVVGGWAGSSSFASGWSGSGWRIDALANAEVTSMTVRGTLSVYELLARRIDAVGGNLLVAPRMKAAAVTDYGTGQYQIVDEYASAIGGLAVSDIEVGSFVIAQVATASGVAQSVLLVLGKSGPAVDVEIISGSAPQVGFVYVAFDHESDASKRGAIYLSSRDSGAPFLSVRQGNGSGVFGSGAEYARLGHLDGLTAFGVALSGYGLASSRARLYDDVVIGSGSEIVRVTGSGIAFEGVGDKLIAAVNGGSLTLSASRINLSGIVTAINGGGAGSTTLDGGRITTGTVTADRLSVSAGGANLLRNSSFEHGPADAQAPSSWQLYSTAGALTWFGRATGAWNKHGASWLLMQGTLPAGSTHYACQDVTVGIEPGRPFVLSAIAYSLDAYHAGLEHLLYVDFYDAPGGAFVGASARYEPSPPPAASFERFELRGTVPALARAARVYVGIRNTSASDYFWAFGFDAVQMQMGDIAGAYSPMPSEVLPGSITGVEIAGGAVLAQHIAAGSVTAAKLGADVATVGVLAARFAEIDTLVAARATIASLEAQTARIDGLAAREIVVGSQVYIGKGFGASQDWDYGSDNLFIGSASASGDRPTIRMQGNAPYPDAGQYNFIEMFADPSSGPWGLRGVRDANAVFELGSTNQIASWAFSTTRLSSSGTSLVSGETVAGYGAFRGLLVEAAGVPRVLVGDFALPSTATYTPASRTGDITSAGFESVTGGVTGTPGAPTPTLTSGGWTLSASGGATADGQTGTVRTGSRALRLSVPRRSGGDGFTPVGTFSAAAAQEFATTDGGRVVRLAMWVRTSAGGFVFGPTACQPILTIEARVSGVLVEVAQRQMRDYAFAASAWSEFVTDVRVPVGATNIKVTLTLTGSGTGDTSDPATALLYVDDVSLVSYDRSVSMLSPDGLAVFASPLGAFRATSSAVEMSALSVQTAGLRLLDVGATDTPPSGQATIFKRGKGVVVRWADGSEQAFVLA